MLKNKWKIYSVLIFFLIVLSGMAKFYHYNYIEHTRGQARTLSLPGFREFVCKDQPYMGTQIDQCGKKSMYSDGDWGVTAYSTIYGIETIEEANSIAQFMEKTRKQYKQTHIPMSVQMFTSPRSEGPTPSKNKIFDADF